MLWVRLLAGVDTAVLCWRGVGGCVGYSSWVLEMAQATELPGWWMLCVMRLLAGSQRT
jgi:hypothetical protein